MQSITQRAVALGAAALVSAGAVSAQFTLSEIFVNPPGTDDLEEALEIRGAPGASLSGIYFLAIEGDGTGSGVVDQSIDLGTIVPATGANGLALVRSGAGLILPGPDGLTAVGVFNFTPDIENGSNTYVLGLGTAPAVGVDIDVDNDGTPDAGTLAGFTVIDSVSIVESGGGSEFFFADDFGGAVLGPFDGTIPLPHTPDAAYRIYDCAGIAVGWGEGDVLGTNPGGPYSFEIGAEASGFPATVLAKDLDLGVVNAVFDLDGDCILDGVDGCPTDPAKGAPGVCGCFVPEGCTLGIDINEISITVGGSQTLSVYAGLANAGNLYIVLGSLSGTSPGVPFQSVLVPLNLDPYGTFTLNNPNSPILSNSLGFLDASGEAVASFNIPPATVLPAPLPAFHAALIIDPFTGVATLATNPVTASLLP
jgi:hypothetical protein